MHEADDGAVLEDNPDSLIAIGSEFGKPSDLHFLVNLVLHGGHQTCLRKFIFIGVNLGGIVWGALEMRLADEDIGGN